MHFSNFLLLASTVSGAAIEKRQTGNYFNHAHNAIKKLDTYYKTPTPVPWTPGWWNNAQIVTLLADLRTKDNSPFIKKYTDGDNSVLSQVLSSQARDSDGALDYTRYFDDRLWWTISLIKTYDVTKDNKYIVAARRTFKRVAADVDFAPCGLMYNAYSDQQYRGSSTITSGLYVEAAAMLATRTPGLKKNYLNKARKEWNEMYPLVYKDGLIQGDGIQKEADGSCFNNFAHLTYLDGTGMSALVALYEATNNATYLDLADAIASNLIAQKTSEVTNGIATEYCDPAMDCANADIIQFKGIMQRGFYEVWRARPTAANGAIPQYLKNNADSVWNKSRGKGGLLGSSWAGPFKRYPTADFQVAGHSSATMALVYAYLVNH
ncbi:putative glycosyl hydrolase family 76 protein [Elsinoe australis]|uniref:Putative glycosyl hydrolase family 76 protein n=1 Tax=Elsinoe australis TaxID=40998 RepID=A0A4V6DWL3_9PEZI|nr:putative glycosyl hydrolase family 76 protein [Elsinoe australis]